MIEDRASNASSRVPKIAPAAVAVLVACLSCAGLVAAPELGARASVDAAKVGQSDPVVLRVTVEGDDAAGAEIVEVPRPPDFRLIQGPNQSTQFQFINGQASSKMVFTMVFAALKTGRLRLPPVKVRVGGQVIQSQPVDVEVVPGSLATQQQRRAQRPGDPFEFGFGDGGDAARAEQIALADDDVMVRLEASRAQAWVGQPVSVSLMVVYRVGINKVDLEKDGKMEGFWVENVELGGSQEQPERRVIDGKAYNAQPLRRWVLFPTRPGRLRLDPWTLRFVAVATSRSFFGFGRQVQALRQSNALEIQVNDFPAQGRPEGFTGLCGRFQMEAGIDKARVRAGEGVNLKVKVSGQGNFRSVPEIKLPEIPGCKVYTPKTQDSVGLQGGDLRGSRTWEFVLVPLDKGSFQVPALDVPYFDPEAGAYRSMRAPATEIVAEAGSDGGGGGGLSGVASLPVELKGRDIRYIRTGPALEKQAPAPLHRRPWFLAAFPALGLGTAGWIVAGEIRRRRRSDLRNWARSRAAVRARKALKKCAELGRAGFSDAFFMGLYAMLQDYLEQRFALGRIELTEVRIRQSLAGLGVPEPDVEGLVRLLQLCESFRYAPASAAESSPSLVLEEARSLLARLEGGAR